MAKLRKIASIERGIEVILQSLSEKEIKDTIGKGASYLRKCSDPDDKDHNLHLNDAIKLDVLSVKSQKGTPFLDHISLIINKEFSDMDKLEDVSRNLINIGGRIGNLMDITDKALHPESPKGEEISKKEKYNIFNAISEVEEKIAKLKLSIK